MIAEHKNTQHNAMLMGNIRTLVGSPGGDIEWLIADTQMNGKCSFFHHYQGSIDFNTVNIHRTVGMYFLVSTGNRGDIE